jgi:pSer/pThr/pTyr-binding forkhead associated (FHA) protein
MIPLSGDSYASGRHAEIRCDAGGCVLVDIGSTNGTFLRREGAAEAERLRAHDPQLLAPGDELRLGQTAFVFHAAPAVAPEAPADGEEQSLTEPSDEAAAPAADETVSISVSENSTP